MNDNKMNAEQKFRLKELKLLLGIENARNVTAKENRLAEEAKARANNGNTNLSKKQKNLLKKAKEIMSKRVKNIRERVRNSYKPSEEIPVNPKMKIVIKKKVMPKNVTVGNYHIKYTHTFVRKKDDTSPTIEGEGYDEKGNLLHGYEEVTQERKGFIVSIDDAKNGENQMKKKIREAIEKYNKYKEWFRRVNIVSIEKVHNLERTDLRYLKMYAVGDVTKYTLLNCLDNAGSKKDEVKWDCVKSYLIDLFSKYTKKMKKVTSERIDQIVNRHRRMISNTQIAGLEINLDDDKKEDLESNSLDNFVEDNFVEEDNTPVFGITPFEVQAICNYFGVSHYCIDTSAKILIKEIRPSKGIPSVAYITNGNHLYPIPRDLIQSISKIQSDFVEIKEEVREIKTVQIYDKWEDRFLDCKGDIFILKEDKLAEKFVEYSTKHNIIYDPSKFRHEGYKMSKWCVNDNLTIWVNPEIQTVIDVCKSLECPVVTNMLKLSHLSHNMFEKCNEGKLISSTLNHVTMDKFLSSKRRGGIIERFRCWDKDLENIQVKCVDINKQYSYALLTIDLPLLSTLDEFKPYKGGEIKEYNFYIADTENMFPLRGPQVVYWGGTLLYAKKMGIPFTIREVLHTRKTYTAVQDFVKYIYDKLDPRLAKGIINRLNGIFGTWFREKCKIDYCKDILEAGSKWFSFESDVFCTAIGEKMYTLEKRTEELKYKNNIPAFTAVVQHGWIQLHQLYMKMGGICETRETIGKGKLFSLSTDCIVICGGTDNEVKFSDEMGGYKRVDSKEVIEKMKRFTKPSRVSDYKDNLKENYGDNRYSFMRPKIKEVITWKELKTDRPETEWREENWLTGVAKSLFERKTGLFLTGFAGTGKTAIVKEFIKLCNSSESKFVVGAPTNKVSCNLGGKTLHKIFRVYDKKNDIISQASIKYLGKLDWFIVDEISMVSEEFLYLFMELRQKGVKFLILGDFNQLPPVEESGEAEESGDFVEDEDIGNSWIIKYICQGNRLSLKLDKRADGDERLSNLRDKILRGEDIIVGEDIIKNDSPITLGERYICHTNHVRKQINRECMELAAAQGNFTELKVKDSNYFQDLKITVNMPIMCMIGYKIHDFYNGQEGIVTGWNKTKIFVKMDSSEKIHEIDRKGFATHITAYYAGTCHKLEGATLSGKVRLAELITSNKSIKNRRWNYTAITRVKSWENISVYSYRSSYKKGLRLFESESF